MSIKCRTCDKVCSYRTEDYVPEYASLLARVARLEEALKELLDYTRACEGLLNSTESPVCVKARRALEEK